MSLRFFTILKVCTETIEKGKIALAGLLAAKLAGCIILPFYQN